MAETALDANKLKAFRPYCPFGVQHWLVGPQHWLVGPLWSRDPRLSRDPRWSRDPSSHRSPCPLTSCPHQPRPCSIPSYHSPCPRPLAKRMHILIPGKLTLFSSISLHSRSVQSSLGSAAQQVPFRNTTPTPAPGGGCWRCHWNRFSCLTVAFFSP